MSDLRRGTPEPPLGLPRIERKPGMADEMLRELAPLLAEEGIDLNDPNGAGVPDLQTLQEAMNRAVERRNMQLFTPVGAARDIAVSTLRSAVEAVLDGDGVRAGEVLDRVVPESPDNSAPTASACMGIALGLLDQWLSGNDTDAPAGLSGHASLPSGHWTGKRAATDILPLASKGRAFRSLDQLIARQGSQHVLAGAVLALAAAIDGWGRVGGTRRADLVASAIR